MARVLLAERDRRIGDFLAGILAEFGHEVATCIDAIELSARLDAEAIDIVLTDFMLLDDRDPGFRRDCEARDIPAISLTGQVLSLDRSALAPLPLIDKPFRFADLSSVVEAVAACTATPAARRPAIRQAA
jgi:DNA-binding response OmpR family regulator